MKNIGAGVKMIIAMRNVYLKLQEEFSPSLTGLRRISEFGGYDFIIDSQGGNIIITPQRRDNEHNK